MTLDSKKVYLMDSGSFTKIGYSADPDERLSSAQSGNPQPMSLAGVIETDHAPRLEEKLHDLLSAYRCEMGGGTEWFDLPEDIHDVLAETSYLSASTLELLPRSGVRECDPEHSLLYLDSVSIAPGQTWEEQREILRSVQERKDRIRHQQRVQHHTTRCVVCDTEAPSGLALLPHDAPLVDRALAQDVCRECAERFLEKDIAPKCAVCDTEYTSSRSFPPNDAHWIDKVVAQDLCRECAEEMFEEG